MTNGKIYIGSGKATKYDGVMVTLDMAEVEKVAYATEHGRYVTFLVARKNQPDDYGKTHNAMVLPKVKRNAEEVATTAVSEPAGDGSATPIGATQIVNGKPMKRISGEEAAKRKAAKKGK